METPFQQDRAEGGAEGEEDNIPPSDGAHEEVREGHCRMMNVQGQDIPFLVDTGARPSSVLTGIFCRLGSVEDNRPVTAPAIEYEV